MKTLFIILVVSCFSLSVKGAKSDNSQKVEIIVDNQTMVKKDIQKAKKVAELRKEIKEKKVTIK